MEKSIYSEEYQLFLKRLKEARRKAGLTQSEMARRLGGAATQSFVSKCERGERRIDIAEMRAFCRAIGLSFSEFVARVDRELDDRPMESIGPMKPLVPERLLAAYRSEGSDP